MAFNVTSNFAGKAAGFYVSAALKQATSLDYLTTMENVKYKSNIQNDHIDLASCDPLIFVVSSFEPLLSPAVSLCLRRRGPEL